MKRLHGSSRLPHWFSTRRVHLRERRRLYRDRIDALRHAPPTADAFFDYLFLLGELNDADLIAELRSIFRREWLPLMRKELARHLRAREFELARCRAADMQWEWQEVAGEGASDVIATLIDHLERPLGSPPPEILDSVVDGFRVVGLESTDAIVQWLVTSAGEVERVAYTLFSRAGTSGRYLVRRWAERDRAVQAWLQTHESHAVPSLPLAGGSCAFWPNERGESPVARLGVARLALDFNPFGPEKAEQDPLLPDLFYRLWPVWQEVTTAQPSVLVCPPGCGRSALIWMMRYESELVGSALDRILPVYAPLHVPLSPPLLARHLQRAVYRATVCFLARHPDALLGLNEAGQWGLGAFMLEVAGGLPPLLIDLERAGFGAAESDSGLLHEALDRIRDRVELRIPSAETKAGEYQIAIVRRLLRDAFTDRELVVFCQDRPAFRPVLDDFGPRFSFADMVDTVINYAVRHDTVRELLVDVDAHNPRQFARYRTALTGGTGVEQIAFPRLHGCDHLFLLVDVSFQDEIDTEMVIECLFERWLPLLAPQHVVPKVFVSLYPSDCPVTPVTMEWSSDALHELLRHRLERAGLVRHDGQPLLEAWVNGVDDAGLALVEAAQGVPENLIRLGNRLMARLGQPAPLQSDEFTRLLMNQ